MFLSLWRFLHFTTTQNHQEMESFLSSFAHQLLSSGTMYSAVFGLESMGSVGPRVKFVGWSCERASRAFLFVIIAMQRFEVLSDVSRCDVFLSVKEVGIAMFTLVWRGASRSVFLGFHYMLGAGRGEGERLWVGS